VTVYATGPDDLSEVRHCVSEMARLGGLDRDRTFRLTIAVNEIVTNAIRHGVPPATVTLTTTRPAVVVAVHDRGAGFAQTEPDTDPPPVDRVDGRGLWLATRLCDEVDVRTDPAGTTVTLVLDRQLPAGPASAP
jgi:anti-sigma regulatory factor (Ser/Thr protein kinase)